MTTLTDLLKISSDLKILYAEDDLNTRVQFGEILNIFFNNIVFAENGKIAWDLYQKENFDIVITDIEMPLMNGLELSSKIKEKKFSQEVIIVSAYGDEEHLLEAIKIGVDAFILKPIEMKQIKDVFLKIVKIIEMKKLHDLYEKNLVIEVEKKTKQLVDQMTIDELTKLYNRKKFDIICASNIQSTLILINLDNFNQINLSFGFSTGDDILKEFANFLKKQNEFNGELFRFGRDEFGYLFENNKLLNPQEWAENLIQKIQKELFYIKDEPIILTATAIISTGAGDELLQNAHIAFKQTRQIGKNRVGIYIPDKIIKEKETNFYNRLKVLNNALLSDLIVPYFQPIIHNKTGAINKFECLARIVVDNKIISPFEFLDVAKLTGMTKTITKTMVDKSFKFFSTKEISTFSINITEDDLRDGYLRDFLHEKLKEYKILPQRVILEVLEGISANCGYNILEQLITLKEDGFKVAIDDFGAQNSNFERVHKLKVDFIKIDGSFIKNIATDPTSYKVAKTITDFSKSIGAQIVAEYVHNLETFEIVKKLDIDYSQGFYLGEPKPYLIERNSFEK